eukprot:CAMPEP_0170545110 /NCGR_PEP_ID=MMETSP0211-20121228/3619_1 /TAXON_ID=311385 /ORGANISM="Pseudokeronopsis sp., Strain OXSARD2" /LENGTH=48 /DNA_ID= /DNA_START= /DNA_END= /DNA_ORIENTATION=
MHKVQERKHGHYADWFRLNSSLDFSAFNLSNYDFEEDKAIFKFEFKNV